MTQCRPLYLLVLVILLRLLGLLVLRRRMFLFALARGLVLEMQANRLLCLAANLSSFRLYRLILLRLQTILLSEVDPAPDRMTESISRIADVL